MTEKNNTFIKCFFCQKEFENAKITKEHIFGKWLIKRANIENKNLVFPNNTRTKYNKLTVPSCTNCNSIFGSRLENEIKSILDNFEDYKNHLLNNDFTPDSINLFENSPRHKIIIWLQKIFFGILYFESNLKNTPKNSFEINKKFTEYFEFKNTCRSILNGRVLNIPTTLLVFELPQDESSFDFFDSFDPLAVGLKIDNKFFYIAISDCQLTNSFLQGNDLHQLRDNILNSRFGAFSYYMAYAYPLSITKNVPISKKFIHSEEFIMNLSHVRISEKEIEIDIKKVIDDAKDICHNYCKIRGIPFIRD